MLFQNKPELYIYIIEHTTIINLLSYYIFFNWTTFFVRYIDVSRIALIRDTHDKRNRPAVGIWACIVLKL